MPSLSADGAGTGVLLAVLLASVERWYHRNFRSFKFYGPDNIAHRSQQVSHNILPRCSVERGSCVSFAVFIATPLFLSFRVEAWILFHT